MKQSTYIMSIDVGMKNLAICVLELSGTTITLHDWDVLDLVPSISCEQCKRPAQFHKKGHYVCRTHAKTTLIENRMYTLPTKQMDIEMFSKKSKASLHELIQTTYPPTLFDKITLDDMKKYKKQELIDYLKTRVPPMYERVSAIKTSQVSFVDYGNAIVQQIDPILSKYSIDAVLIENQISPLANRMKTLQGMLTQYFVMREISTIEYISSANKLKVREWTQQTHTIPVKTGKQDYSNRKKAGIQLTQHLMRTPVLFIKTQTIQLNVDRGTHFSTHKKQDDLADAFLQGIWWFVSHWNM